MDQEGFKRKRVCGVDLMSGWAFIPEENKSKYPEIRIEWVWEELVVRKCTEDEMRKLCITFREKSRDRFGVYDGVFEAFCDIKQNGGRIFLLSNAQRLFTEKELDDRE